MRRNRRKSGLIAVAVLALLCLPTVCFAESRLLQEAESAFAEINFAKTLSSADEAIKQGGLDRDSLAHALQLVGVAAIALDQEERSIEAVTRLIAIDPDSSHEADLAPRFREPFMEARGFWATQRAPFGIEVDFVAERGELRFTLSTLR